MDVYNSFIQGDLDEKVHMNLPNGFKQPGMTGKTKVYKLLKFLYGLKQASRQWNIKLTYTLLDVGFSQNTHDYSLFTFKKAKYIVVVLVLLMI